MTRKGRLIHTIQSEATKYFRVSVNRHWKSSTICHSLGGVLGSARRQDEQVHGLQGWDCWWTKWQTTSSGYRSTLANISRRDGCMFFLEPLVIQGLSHSVYLGISFLMKHNLKINCTEEEVALIPVKDWSTSRARLVDGRYGNVAPGRQVGNLVS